MCSFSGATYKYAQPERVRATGVHPPLQRRRPKEKTRLISTKNIFSCNSNHISSDSTDEIFTGECPFAQDAEFSLAQTNNSRRFIAQIPTINHQICLLQKFRGNVGARAPY